MTALEALKKYPTMGETIAVNGYRDAELEMCLDIAADVILKRRFPFGTKVTEVPERYFMLQVQIAAELVNKLGAEGQLRHSEGEITREYAASYVSPDLLRRIIPMAGVPKDEDAEPEQP